MRITEDKFARRLQVKKKKAPVYQIEKAIVNTGGYCYQLSKQHKQVEIVDIKFLAIQLELLHLFEFCWLLLFGIKLQLIR